MRRLLMVSALVGSLAAPGPGAAQSRDHLAAAAELLEAMQVGTTIREAVEASFEAQITSNPDLEPFRDVMMEFANKYLSWEALKPQLSRLYAETFTMAELRELAAFHRTPVGRKLVAAQPELMRRGSELGQAAVMAHMDELQAMIQRRAQELERN